MKNINRCILAFTALLFCSQVFAANLLVNGDFTQADPTNPETVAPPGWTNVGDSFTENEGVIANSFRGTPAYQRPGQPATVNFYDFGGNGRGYSTVNTGVAQTFATVPGRQYRLTFAMSSEFACTDDKRTVNTTRVTAGSLSVDVPVPYMPSVVCMQGPAETAAFKKPWVVKTYTFSATGASTTLTFMTTVADDYGSNDPFITGVEVTEISPLLTVNKQLAGSGRLHVDDQFTVQIKDANNTVVNDITNSITKGSGATVLDGSGTTGATRLVSGATYTLAEVMAVGSASPLSSYSSTVACTNANAAGTNVAGINRLGSSVVLAAEDVVTLQSGSTQIYPPLGSGLSVVAQQKICVILQQYVPATAQVGYKNDARLQAAFAYSNANPALSANYTVMDTTQVDNVSLNLFKEVRNVTQNGSFGANNQAKSGDVLEYRITYTNMSPAVLSNLSINDTTPAFTSYVSSTVGNTPATLTACTKSTPANPAPSAAVSCTATQAAGGVGAVIWRFSGSLPGSASGQVLFQVKVD